VNPPGLSTTDPPHGPPVSFDIWKHLFLIHGPCGLFATTATFSWALCQLRWYRRPRLHHGRVRFTVRTSQVPLEHR